MIPWPELFSLDANPGNALVFDPALELVLVGHYAILVVGALLGLLAAVALVGRLRERPAGPFGAWMLAAACGLLAIASSVRAVDSSVNDGRGGTDVEWMVWGGGTVLLASVVLLTWALREPGGRWFLALGFTTPCLVAGGIAAFAAFGQELYPEIWGVTFPPPTDYLLGLWFIALGGVTSRLPPRAAHAPPARRSG